MSQPPPTSAAPPPAVVNAPDLPPIGRPIRRRRAIPLLLASGIVVAIGLLVLHDSVRYYRVSSGSMRPTLPVGKRIAAEPGLSPQVGEIVVFHPPGGAVPPAPTCGAPNQGTGFQQPCGAPLPEAKRAILVKRVVAGPGDLVALRDGRAVVNGVTRPEQYVAPCGEHPSCSFPIPVRVPRGDYFVLGDNRGDSDDSRFWGPVPAAWILGVVVHCQLLQTACTPVR